MTRNTLYMLSPRLCFFIVLKCDLFIHRDDSLTSLRHTACLVFIAIMIEGYAALYSFTAVVQASDSMTASM